MHISDLVFQKKKIFYFIMVALVVGGIFSFRALSKLEDPEVIAMVANVVTVYPGASAHDVEMQVTSVLEEEISALSDISSIKSRSEANVSVIELKLEMSVPQEEMQQRWEFLRRKIDLAMRRMPEGVQEPVIYDDVSDVYGMFYAMVGDRGYSYEEMSVYADFIRRQMLEIDGVSKVNIYGEQHPEILITISPDRFSETGILPLQIFMALGDYAGESYSGHMFSGEQQLRITVSNKSSSIEDLGNIIISSAAGASYKLGDLADISYGYPDPMRNQLFVNNQKALGIGISMESGENIIQVGKDVEHLMSELRPRIPNGLSFEKVFFQPDKVSDSIRGFMRNLILSVTVVIVVLMFTMGFRGGVIIGSGLLITILATFPFLLLADGTLQRISLGAFIVAMGMLVDNAIVVLDGILVDRKLKKAREACTLSAKKTAIPLLGATAIAITAFLPVYLSQDIAGTYARDLFVVLAISLGISWILSLTQVPVFASFFYKNKKDRGEKDKEAHIYNKPLYRITRRILDFSLHNRLIVIAVVVILLLVAFLNFKKVDNTFFPDFEYNQSYIEYLLPVGNTPESVYADLLEISDYLNSFDEVDMVVTSLGMTPMRYCLVRGVMTENADNYGEIIINFQDYKTMKKMQPLIQDYLHLNHPEAQSRIRDYTLSVASSHRIEVEFTGPDPAVLKELGRKAEDYMLQNKHVDKYTVSNDWEPKAKTLKAIYSPIAGNRASVTRGDISTSILAASDGLPLTRIYQGETPLTVRFRIRDKEGKRIEDLNDIPVWPTIPNIGGVANMQTVLGIMTGAIVADDLLDETLTAVPLSTVTDGVVLDWEEPLVRRINSIRAIQAQCDPVDNFSPSHVQDELDELISIMPLPAGYSYRWVGEQELKKDGLEGIFGMLPLAAGIILLILLLLFADYKRPLIIILCLPLAIIGIVPGLILSGQPFSFVAIIGAVGLSGMIIKNAIVLLDEINNRLLKSSSAYHAIVDATISRTRPVVMASLTTILGMIPLFTDPMYASLAATIIGGLLIGTLVTLVFVPVLYSSFFAVPVPQSKNRPEIIIEKE